MGVFRAIAGVIVGYIVMFAGVFVTLSIAWSVLKADGAFMEAPSWEHSTTWIVASLVLGLVVAIGALIGARLRGGKDQRAG